MAPLSPAIHIRNWNFNVILFSLLVKLQIAEVIQIFKALEILRITHTDIIPTGPISSKGFSIPNIPIPMKRNTTDSAPQAAVSYPILSTFFDVVLKLGVAYEAKNTPFMSILTIPEYFNPSAIK